MHHSGRDRFISIRLCITAMQWEGCAACDIIAISLPLRLTSLRCSTGDVIEGSVKEELGEREREREGGLRRSDGCWETQCATAGTQTHTAGK